MANLRVFSGIDKYDFTFTDEQLKIILQLYESIERAAEKRYPKHVFYYSDNTLWKDYFVDGKKVSEEEYEEAKEFENIGKYLRKKEIDNTFKKILLTLSEAGVIERTEFGF
jgi:hypothetical protein